MTDVLKSRRLSTKRYFSTSDLPSSVEVNLLVSFDVHVYLPKVAVRFEDEADVLSYTRESSFNESSHTQDEQENADPENSDFGSTPKQTSVFKCVYFDVSFSARTTLDEGKKTRKSILNHQPADFVAPDTLFTPTLTAKHKTTPFIKVSL